MGEGGTRRRGLLGGKTSTERSGGSGPRLHYSHPQRRQSGRGETVQSCPAGRRRCRFLRLDQKGRTARHASSNRPPAISIQVDSKRSNFIDVAVRYNRHCLCKNETSPSPPPPPSLPPSAATASVSSRARRTCAPFAFAVLSRHDDDFRRHPFVSTRLPALLRRCAYVFKQFTLACAPPTRFFFF